MARSESTISVLQFAERSAVFAHIVAEEGQLRVEHCSTLSLDDSASLRVSDTPDQEIIAVIPRHQATVRILTLPSREPAEIASMVALASEEFAPYPREQLAVQHRVLSTLQSGESRVLVVLIHHNVIQQHVEKMSVAGLEPSRMLFGTACLHAAACAAPHAPRGRYGLACVSAESLEMLVLHEGTLEFSRGVAHHAPWALDDPTGVEALGHEIRDALAAWRRESEDGEGLDALYVVADAMDGVGLAAALESNLGRPCRPADFMSHNDPSQKNAPIIAMGAALAACGRATLDFDFLPPSLVQARTLRNVQAGLRRVAFLAAVILLLLAAAFGQSVYQRMTLIQELQSQIEAASPGVEDIAAKQKGLDAIARQVDQGGNVLALLAAVAEAAPPEGFNVTRVAFDRETGMDLWGRAQSKDIVLRDFLGSLRALGAGSLAQLAQAHSQYETAGQERNQAIVNYQVSIPALTEEPPHGAPAQAR